MTSYTLEVKYAGCRQPKQLGPYATQEKALTAALALMKNKNVEKIEWR